jgi:hypothetical protein
MELWAGQRSGMRGEGLGTGERNQRLKCKMQNCGGPSGKQLLIATKRHEKALYLSFMLQNVQNCVIFNAK